MAKQTGKQNKGRGGNDKFDNAGEVGVWEDLKGNQNGKRNKGGGWGGWRPKRRKFRV
jgi:hypothetical protein